MTFWTNVRDLLAGRRAAPRPLTWICHGCRKPKIGKPILHEGRLFCSAACQEDDAAHVRLLNRIRETADS